jgi:hypothetical protein
MISHCPAKDDSHVYSNQPNVGTSLHHKCFKMDAQQIVGGPPRFLDPSFGQTEKISFVAVDLSAI